jgi:serine/threonine protein kinase
VRLTHRAEDATEPGGLVESGPRSESAIGAGTEERGAEAERTPESPAVAEAARGGTEGDTPPLRSDEPRGSAASDAPGSEDEGDTAPALEREAVPAEFELTSNPPYEPPFVDEVPDPVTPYEQRASETIRVTDLPPVDQLRGRVLANRYLAEEVAEKSALSLSYRAYHLALDRAITVRILPRGLACGDEACQDVRSVAGAASALGHPNVAVCLDFGVLSDGWPFIVTEHFEGRTLGLILAEEGKLLLRRVLHVGKQLAFGLSAAHDAGLIHGMLNPDNVLIIEPGTPAEVATILGFGVINARGRDPGPPRNSVFGVPFYLSPEHVNEVPLGPPADIYSLGIILYEMITGRPPFMDGGFTAVAEQHLGKDAEPPSSRLNAPGALAKALDAIVERCLRKDPAQRYQNTAELVDDLERLEAAAARTKRRPMPEVKRPTATIHAPHPRADSPAPPGAKVIVHDEDEQTPQSGGVRASARKSTPPASKTVAPRKGPKPARISVDQATIKISAVDRERLLSRRPGSRPGSSWQSGGLAARARELVDSIQQGLAWLAGAIRRLVAAANRRDDSRG